MGQSAEAEHYNSVAGVQISVVVGPGTNGSWTSSSLALEAFESRCIWHRSVAIILAMQFDRLDVSA